MHSNTTSTTSTVTGARHAHTEIVSLSARPQITNISPSYEFPGEYLQLKAGFNANLELYGYSLTHTASVYVSAHEGVYTNALSAVSEYDLFSNAVATTGRDLLSQFPAFSGVKLDTDQWHVINDHSMTITVSAAQAAGNLDLIICNVAGYAMFTKDMSGCSIVVSV